MADLRAAGASGWIYVQELENRRSREPEQQRGLEEDLYHLWIRLLLDLTVVVTILD